LWVEVTDFGEFKAPPKERRWRVISAGRMKGGAFVRSIVEIVCFT
jgi:hypothetical protein